MAAAIVELDALADAVGPAAQDDDFLLIAGIGFALRLAAHRRLVGRIHVGRQRLEFGGASVDTLVAGMNIERVAGGAHLRFLLAGELGQPRIGEAHGFEAAEALVVLGQAVRFDRSFGLDDGFDLAQEPGIIAGDLLDFRQRKAVPHRLGGVQQAVGRGPRQRGADRGLVVGERDLVKAGEAGFQRPQRFLDATRRRCGRSPLLRPPISSTWSAAARRRGISRRRSGGSW